MNALELAQNCFTAVSGKITEREVTGESQPGSKVTLKSGDLINIKTVTVVDTFTISAGQTVNVSYKIPVGKTIRNI